MPAARRANPTYENHAGHLEAVKVTYDPAKISYAQLVDGFFHHIDPTDPNGQICDKGPSYRTAVFVATPQERAGRRGGEGQGGEDARRAGGDHDPPAAPF